MFSASILHQVSRVTRGRRYVFLTFLFDEEAERLRQANSQGRAGGATRAAPGGERLRVTKDLEASHVTREPGRSA